MNVTVKRPPKKKCCVPGCNDRVSSRFRFPRRNETDMVQLWLKAINNEDLYNLPFEKLYQNNVVCARHFYTDELQHGFRRGLKRTAVPSLFLHTPHQGKLRIIFTHKGFR